MADGSEIKDLPARISSLAKAFSHAASALAVRFIDRMVESDAIPWPLFSLKAARFSWRLYLVNVESHVVFFFMPPSLQDERLVLDADISFRVATASHTHEPERIMAEAIRRRIVLPDFIKPQPSSAEIEEFAPAKEGATQKNAMFLTLGPQRRNFLVVMNPDNEEKAQFRYSPAGMPGSIEPHDGKWPLEPFLDLIETIGSWVKGGFEIGPDMVLEVESLGDRSEVRRILFTIIEAYSEAVNGVRMDRPAPDLLVSALAGRYDVSDFQARVLLRLKPDGTLASENKDDPFQLMMLVRMIEEGENLKARVAVGPPDFLVSGVLYQAFLEELRRKEALEEIAQNLALPVEEVGLLLRVFGKSGVIFRTKREGILDTDVLVLPKSASGSRATLMILGRFTVETTKDPPRVTLEAGSIRNLLVPGQDPETPFIEFEAVRYFLRLLCCIRMWIGVLQ
jgi:hypothetical protein